MWGIGGGFREWYFEVSVIEDQFETIQGPIGRKQTYLFVGVALKYARSVEDVDKNRHDSLEEDGVRGHVCEDIEVVAQLRRSFDLAAGVWNKFIISACVFQGQSRESEKRSCRVASREDNLPASCVARRLTTSSSNWPCDEDDIVTRIDQVESIL